MATHWNKTGRIYKSFNRAGDAEVFLRITAGTLAKIENGTGGPKKII